MTHIFAFIFIVLGALIALAIYFAVELHKQYAINKYCHDWLIAVSKGYENLRQLHTVSNKDAVSCEEKNSHDNETTTPVQDR